MKTAVVVFVLLLPWSVQAHEYFALLRVEGGEVVAQVGVSHRFPESETLVGEQNVLQAEFVCHDRRERASPAGVQGRFRVFRHPNPSGCLFHYVLGRGDHPVHSGKALFRKDLRSADRPVGDALEMTLREGHSGEYAVTASKDGRPLATRIQMTWSGGTRSYATDQDGTAKVRVVGFPVLFTIEDGGVSSSLVIVED